MKTIMIGTATPRVSPDTFTLTVPKAVIEVGSMDEYLEKAK